RLAADLIAELDDLDARANDGADPEPLNIVIVGGGPTGVETAGAIAEAISTVVPHYFSSEVQKHCAVHLVDRGPTVLGPFSAKSQTYARERLEALGVHLHLGIGVKEVAADSVTLSDDSTLPTRIVVWAGGLQAEPVVGTAGAATGRGGRIDVDADLTVPGVDGLYALGDAANIPDGHDGTLPQLGSVALQSGHWAAANIMADLAGEPRRAFEYTDRGFMAMIGRMAAVAEIGPDRKQIQGPAAFAGWLAVHAALLPSMRSRFDAVRNWSRDYLTDSRSETVLEAVEQPPTS
ncbi:MAG: FAD-dependent oxidoreductase, partial [Gordonia sp. (in: high G+C Gram-positive bacteria)]